jgi:ArsR family transcriptional regulator
MEREAALLRALGDPTRLRLAVLLAVRGEMCVCDLARSIGGPAYRISRHLSVMRSAGIVEARREGTWMHYRLSLEGGGLARSLMECLGNHFQDDPALDADSRGSEKNCCGDHKRLCPAKPRRRQGKLRS